MKAAAAAASDVRKPQVYYGSGIPLPVGWLEAHHEDRGFDDEEWAIFLKGVL